MPRPNERAVRVVYAAVALHWAALCFPITSYNEFVISLPGGSLLVASAVISARSLVAMMVLPRWGAASDGPLGRRVVAAASAFIMSLGYLLVATVPWIWGTEKDESDGEGEGNGTWMVSPALAQVVAGRVIIGASMGVQAIVSAALNDMSVADLAAERDSAVELGTILQPRMATLGAFSAVGFMLAVPCGGFLTSHVSPVAPEFASFVASLLNAALLYFGLRYRGESTPSKSSKPKKSQAKSEEKSVSVGLLGIFTSPDLGMLRLALLFRALWELTMGIINNWVVETLRTSPVASLEPSPRGLFLMFAGAICVPVMQGSGGLVKLAGSEGRALSGGAIATLVCILLMALSPGRYGTLGSVLAFSVCSCFVAPLSSSVTSEIADSSMQGAVLGAIESLVNLGAIVGPLVVAFLMPAASAAPALCAAVMCVLSMVSLRAFSGATREKQD
jgi:MFS family permease